MFQDRRILTIDDSVAVCNYLRSALVRQGATVEIAHTGQEGLDVYARFKPDLVLLDLILPDLNGLEVLERIRAEDEQVTIVILTGVGGVKSAIAAMRSGADSYVEKQDISVSGDLGAFFFTLEQALERRASIVAQKKFQQLKADFYAMVTHDLRNPASGIISAVQILLDAKQELPASEKSTIYHIIERSARKMLDLINNYLDFAEIDAGYLRLNMSLVDLRDIVQTSTQLARLQAHVQAQTLVLDLPPRPVFVRADAERLHQVLDNLLSNALKYTLPGGRIVVQLCVEDGQAAFSVSDTGRGIPPAQLPALFTKYHRIPGEATMGIRGTGLGLLIVKEIVEAHGGTVRAESTGVPGEGSTFTVHLPLAPAPQNATGETDELLAPSP